MRCDVIVIVIVIVIVRCRVVMGGMTGPYLRPSAKQLQLMLVNGECPCSGEIHHSLKNFLTINLHKVDHLRPAGRIQDEHDLYHRSRAKHTHDQVVKGWAVHSLQTPKTMQPASNVL